MHRLSAIAACLLAACGTLEPADHEPPVVSDPDGVAPTNPANTPEPPVFVTPPGFDPLLETWRVDLRGIEMLPGSTWEGIHSDLAVVVLRDDAPSLDVRLGTLIPDTSPPLQDWCSPTSTRIEGGIDLNGAYQVQIPGEQVELGQSWMFDALWLTGVRDGNVATMEVVASIPAIDLARVAFEDNGQAPCDQLAFYDLECFECVSAQSLGGELCVKFPLTGALTEVVDGFDLEPISSGDVAANPACD